MKPENFSTGESVFIPMMHLQSIGGGLSVGKSITSRKGNRVMDSETISKAVKQLLDILENEEFSRIVVERQYSPSSDNLWVAYAILWDDGVSEKPFKYAIYFDNEGHMEADGV